MSLFGKKEVAGDVEITRSFVGGGEYEEIWLRAWCAAAAGGKTYQEDCTIFANRCLSDFQLQFRTADKKGGAS